MSLDIDRCHLYYRITASWIHCDTTMFLLSGQLTQINRSHVWLLWVSYSLSIDVVIICLSLFPLNSFHQNVRNCINLERRLRNSLFCVAFSNASLLLCHLSLLHSVNTLRPLPSSRVFLTTGTSRKEGRRKVSSYFQFKLGAPEVWLIEWLHIS